MATYAWDVPGYVQGHRFASDRRFWDPVTGRFSDRAGYDHLGNHCEVALGTPVFSTHGARNREGVIFNNACHMKFLPATPWEGTMLLVIKHTQVTINASLGYIYLWGTAASVPSNGRITMQLFSGQRQFLVASSGSILSAGTGVIQGWTDGSTIIVAWSMSQETRMLYWTRDGVTVGTIGPPAAAIHGGAAAMGGGGLHEGAGSTIGNISSTYVRVGDMIGDGSVTPNASDYVHIFEHHFWKGNQLIGAGLPQMAAFINSLKTYYGI